MAEASAVPGVLWPVKKVFLWLLVLTVAEVGVVYLHLPKAALALVLVLGALWKAAIVVLHFMHMRIERRLIVLALVATTVLAGIFVLGLFPDIVLGPGAERAGG
jgi:caa(3)-type oxidase subunit IV